MAQRIIPVQVTKGPEYYHGEPTGKTQWTTETLPDMHGAHNDVLSVLGRSTHSPEDSVRNWEYRAQLDGHDVKAKVES